MSRFSVKKPFTVFVAVIAAILFGVISYTRMTPDLLPNMDFPYIVLVTTYPGATPEEVEEQVTKPLEQSMATLNNISGLSSTSAENYSMIMMEFEMDTNMDSVTVDILQKTQALTGQWDESIGTPSIIRINPNMIPVMVAAVNAEGMDRAELCRLAQDTLIPELEGTTGLASISTGGLVQQSLTLQINDAKIDATNQKIEEALRKSLEEAKEKLDDAQAELDENSEKVENGLAALSNAGKYMDGLNNSGSTDDITALATEIAAINSQLNAANSEKQALEAEKDLYVNQLSQIEASVKPLEDLLNQTRANRAKIKPVLDAGMSDDTLLADMEIEADTLAYLTGMGCTTVGDARALDNSLAATEIETTLNLQDTKDTLAATKAAAEARLPVIDQEIAAATAKADALQKQADAKAEEIAQIQAGLDKLPGQIAQGMGQLTAATAQLSAAQAALMSAQQTLDQAYDTYETQMEAALNAADLHNIISLEMLASLVAAQNFDMPAGYVHEHGRNIIVTVGEGINGISELEELVLFDMGLDNLDPIRLTDVADVVITDNSEEIYATLNGSDGLILMFSKQSNYATAKVSDNLRESFDEISEKYPGVTFSPLMDQGDYIYLIRDSIMSSLLWGALFSVLILFLFLRDWRPTLITLLSIPVSLLFSLTLMYFSGVSMNMMSMSGLAISVGMLVDNSVVVIENIYRLRALGESRIKAAVSGAGQVGGAIVASTLTTVCVFVPIAFVDGLTRELFTDMVLTLAFSLLASLIVAMTLVPAMGSRLLREYKEPQETVFTRMMAKYRKSVAWGVEHKRIMLVGSLAMLILSSALVLVRGFTFMPEMEMEQMMATMTMPSGTTFAETREMADEVARRIAAVDGVGTVGGTIEDSGSGNMPSGEERGASVSFYVLLDENTRRKPRAVAEEINAVCADMDCEVTADASSMMGTMMEMMSGSGVTVRVYSNDMDTLKSVAHRIGSVMEQVEGVAKVNTGSQEPTPEMRFVVNKEKALKEGLTVAQVYMEVAEALTGSAEILELTDDGLTYNVIIETKSTENITPNYLRNLEFKVTDQRTGEERTVRLRDVAQLYSGMSLTSINRMEQRRYLDVTGEIAEGYNVTLVTNEVEDAVRALELPHGASLAFSGERENIMDAMKDLLLLLLVGIILVYMVMVAQFQNLKSPFIVMFTIPLAFTGGFLALFLCGMELSLLSMLGMVMLVGIIVNNGIVLVDYINQLRQGGMERRDAIVDAACTRLRPILMTSITTILGLLIMALGQNEATSLIQPLAVTCIGGLLYATAMTLYVVPVMYDILAKKPPLAVDEADLELSTL